MAHQLENDINTVSTYHHGLSMLIRHFSVTNRIISFISKYLANITPPSGFVQIQMEEKEYCRLSDLLRV